MNDKIQEVLHIARAPDALYCDNDGPPADPDGSASISITAVVLAVIHPLPSVEDGAQLPKELLLPELVDARSV
jgi:hypothetical protein